MKSGIPTWTSITKYVDVDTGEQITKHTFELHYYKIKTLKHATVNKTNSVGFIEYTVKCRRKPEQTTIF